MSNDGVNISCCIFLIGLILVVGVVGVLGVVVFFVKFWQFSVKVENVGVLVQVDISKLEMGQCVVQEW